MHFLLKTDSKSKRIIHTSIILVLILCIILGAVVTATNFYMIHLVSDNIISVAESAAIEDADCIIVLGCLVNGDGTPSDRLEDRLTVGCELYQSGAAPKLLMSGDHGRKDYDEVGAMKKFATDLGVPSEDVFMDHDGFSTYETMYRAREVFGCTKVIISTQKYHLSRALYIAESLGLEAYGVAADIQEYDGMEYKQIREIVARTKDFFYVMAEPDVADEVVYFPISGNGDDTNGLIGSYD